MNIDIYLLALVVGAMLFIMGVVIENSSASFIGFILILVAITCIMIYSGTMEANIQEEAQYDYLTSDINQTRLMTDDLYNEEIRDMYQKELKHNTSARISDRYAKHET